MLTERRVVCKDGVPAWIGPFIERVRPLLDIQDWFVQVSVDQRPQADDGYCTASVRCESRYFQAYMYLDVAVLAADTPQNREMILHELLHIRNEPVDLAVEQFVNLVVSKAWQRKAMLHIYADYTERVVTRLAQGLFPLISYYVDNTDLELVRTSDDAGTT